VATAPETSWTEACCQIAGVVVVLGFHTAGTLGFEATKILLLRLLGLILLAGWLARETGAFGGDVTPFAWRRRLPELRQGPAWPVVLTLAGFVLALMLATAASIQPLVSLLGSWDRQQGLATSLAWIALGIAAAYAGRREARRRGLLIVWCLASAPVCLYAFVQQFHLDPIRWLNQPLGVTSTLGSSTALATYLAMLLPLTLALAVDASRQVGGPSTRRRGWTAILSDPRVRYGGCIALLTAQVAAMLMTQVRGGLLAAGVGLVVTVCLLLARRRPRLAVLIGGPLVVVLAVTAVGMIVLPRADVGDGADTSAFQRLSIWQDALQTIAGPRILLGFGPETQMTALEARYPVELAQRFENARFDRAHNLVLDQLLTTGLLGTLALLALIVAVARVGFLRAAQPEAGPSDHLAPDSAHGTSSARILDAGLLGAFAANIVANLVAFDSSVTGALFWMVAGLIVAPGLPPEQHESAPAPALDRRTRRRQRQSAVQNRSQRIRMRTTAGLAAIAVGLAAIPWLTAPFLADLYHTRALGLRAGEAPGSSIRQELNAAQSTPWLDVPVLSLGETFLELARGSNLGPSPTPTSFSDLFEMMPTSRTGQFEAARLALERAVSINPLDPYPHAALARLWVARAEASRDPSERADAYGRAVSEYDRAIETGPSRVDLYDEAGVALTRWGKPDLALERFRQADALTHPTSERLARMGDAKLEAGDPMAARALYEQALGLDARSAPGHAGLAGLDRAAGDLTSALDHAQRAARYQMRNWVYHRDLAQVYQALGMFPEGLAEARTARRMAPAWEADDLNALIQSLNP